MLAAWVEGSDRARWDNLREHLLHLSDEPFELAVGQAVTFSFPPGMRFDKAGINLPKPPSELVVLCSELADGSHGPIP